ncbi:proline-rich protein 36-like [Camarhynchus parvulus]|uniref:proline-rich protein 36-like n=1 Tax=Geospiza parvula TaxID=87175 RepID=UPI00123804A7|nr:proline-rich protein 36-like [Camarhynchus parvulus]
MSPFPYAALGSSLEKVRREPLRRRAIFAGSLPRCRRNARRRPERAGQGSRLPVNPRRLRGGGRHRRAAGRGPSEPGRDSASCPWSRRPRSFQSRVSELERSHPGMLERNGRSRAALAGENEARRQGRREPRASLPRCPRCSPPREPGGHGGDRAETRVPGYPQVRGSHLTGSRSERPAARREPGGRRPPACGARWDCGSRPPPGPRPGQPRRRSHPRRRSEPLRRSRRVAGGQRRDFSPARPARPGSVRLFTEWARGYRCFRAPLSAAPPAGTGRGPTPAPRRRREGRGPGPSGPEALPGPNPLSAGSPQPRGPPSPPATCARPRAPPSFPARPGLLAPPRRPPIGRPSPSTPPIGRTLPSPAPSFRPLAPTAQSRLRHTEHRVPPPQAPPTTVRAGARRGPGPQSDRGTAS